MSKLKDLQNVVNGMKAEAEASLALVGWNGPYKKAAVGKTDEDAKSGFSDVMKERGEGKEAYIVARDELRKALRVAQAYQRALRSAGHAAKADGLGATSTFSSLYNERVRNRYYITALIRVRRAGKAWAKEARDAALSAGDTA